MPTRKIISNGVDESISGGYIHLNAAEHRGNKPETHRLARRTRNPPRPRKAKASSGIDRPRKGKTISQMPFARGASRKSTRPGGSWEMPTQEELHQFLRAWYLHSRFEGRDGPVWGRDYSMVVTLSHMEQLERYGETWISRHESRTANPIKYDSSLRILNADAPPTEIPRATPSLGRIIHGQAW